jgi:WD40 repeat protein
VAYSPDGKLLALANRGLVDVWDVSKNTLSFQLRGHLDFVYAVTFSPDGKWIATGGWDQSIRLWDRSTGNLVRTIRGHRGFVRGLAFRPDSRQLISCSEDKSVRLWDVASGRELAAFHGHMGFVHCVAFSPDGARAASGSLDCTIRLWPAAAPDPHVVFRNGSGWVGTMVFSPDGRRIATAHNGSIRIWVPQTGEELWSTTGPRGLLGRIALAFSSDGANLVASGPGGAINLWNSENGTLLRELARTPLPAVSAALSPDGSLLAAACDDGATIVLNMSTGSTVRTIKGHAAGINAVAISADGSRLATASEDQKVKVWELATGTLLQTLNGHVTGVKGVAFAPDGRSLASVGGQYRGTPVSEVFVWDLASGSLIHRLDGHTSLVTAVAYFPDGGRLATASDDRTIKLWDPNTGDDVFTLRGHTSGVVCLALSRDGRQIGSGGIDCTARIWSAEPPATRVDQVRRRAVVDLVQTLFRTHLLKSKVLEAIRTDPSLNEPSRAAAREIANRESEDAQSLYETARLTILRPTAQAELIQQALEQIEAACKLVTADPDRLQEYQHTLALALYRAGRFEEAIQMLDHLNAKASPVDLAVRAMASQQLGRPDAARAALYQLRSVATAKGTGDQEAQSFLHEAESVVLK